MTRKSKRELEQAVNSLDGDGDDAARPPSIVYEDPDTGEWYDGPDADAARVDRAACGPDGPIMVLATPDAGGAGR